TQQRTVDLTRVFGDVELPAAGLWNIPPGWATIELSVPRLLGTTMRSMIRLKQGMIAIADDPSHSTAHLSLDALSIRTGEHAVDEFLHHEVLDADRYSTIPVRIAGVRHRSGAMWSADGWVTVRGVATALDFEITYEGLFHKGPAALFRAQTSLPLGSVLPINSGLRSRFFASRTLRIAIELYAEPVRAKADHTARRRLPHLAAMSSSRHTAAYA
ncbi:MAG TPA: YceI family protein, partial [Ilumatobacteraceae bacterium]